MDHYNFGREHILFLHAVTGCDTTSTFFNKGKVKVLKLLENRPDLQSAAAVFKNQNCSVQDIFKRGIKFILAMYGAQKQVVSIDNYRYITFAKLTRNNKPVKLSSLPPTNSATQQHLLRVYYQVQIWLGNKLNPENWGWIMNNNVLEPIMTLLPPAPDELVNMIFCNSKKGCGTTCSCKKIGIKCSIICGHCREQSCFNSSSDNALDDNIIDTLDVLSADLTEGDNTYNFEKNDEEEEEMHEDESDDDNNN